MVVGAGDVLCELQYVADCWHETPPRVVLVEPDPSIAKSLRSRVRVAEGGPALSDERVPSLASAVVVEAAVRPLVAGRKASNDSSEVPFFRVRRASNSGASLSAYSSLDQDVAISSLATDHIAEAERRIDVLSVKQISPVGLLREANVTPAAVEALIVNTLGFNIDVVESFLSVDRFAPFYLKFRFDVAIHHRDSNNESVVLSSRQQNLTRIQRTLESRGYKVGSHGYDVTAFRARPVAGASEDKPVSQSGDGRSEL